MLFLLFGIAVIDVDDANSSSQILEGMSNMFNSNLF